MAQGTESGWSIVLDALTAFGTLGAVAVALFGDQLRQRFFPPGIRLTFPNPQGEKSINTLLSHPDQDTILESDPKNVVLFYGRIERAPRSPKVSRTLVSLVKLEQVNSAGIRVTKWESELPMAWRHMRAMVTMRVLGNPLDWLMFEAVAEKFLMLPAQMRPPGTGEVFRWRCGTAADIIMTFRADGEDVDPVFMSISAKWDGQIPDRVEDLAQHLALRDITGTDRTL